MECHVFAIHLGIITCKEMETMKLKIQQKANNFRVIVTWRLRISVKQTSAGARVLELGFINKKIVRFGNRRRVACGVTV